MQKKNGERVMLSADQLGAILQTLLQRGFEPPLHFAIISGNGSIAAGSYTAGADGLDRNVVADHSPTGIFSIPINVLFVDRNGEAARILLTADGKPQYIN